MPPVGEMTTRRPAPCAGPAPMVVNPNFKVHINQKSEGGKFGILNMVVSTTLYWQKLALRYDKNEAFLEDGIVFVVFI